MQGRARSCTCDRWVCPPASSVLRRRWLYPQAQRHFDRQSRGLIWVSWRKAPSTKLSCVPQAQDPDVFVGRYFVPHFIIANEDISHLPRREFRHTAAPNLVGCAGPVHRHSGNCPGLSVPKVAAHAFTSWWLSPRLASTSAMASKVMRWCLVRHSPVTAKHLYLS